jgi:hypothetical protein
VKTTTQFPVVPGTVVEVTCSESGAVNKGSSAVTCSRGTTFTYLKEPSCSNSGKSIYPKKTLHSYKENYFTTM